MTALLEFKQKLKNLYGRMEIYILPVLKFALAMVWFYWINENMGYFPQLNNIFVLLILSLICSILPSGVMAFAGFVLIIGHSYGLGYEAFGFTVVLIILLAVLLLRFSNGQNAVLVCTPLSFGFDIPVLLPIGSGLLGNAFTVFPAATGVVLYYYIRLLRQQADMLRDTGYEALEKLKILADGLVQNWPMWMTVVAFVITILMVNLIRTRSFDYAWRIAIIAGGVTYVLTIVLESYFVDVQLDLTRLLIQAAISVVAGIILEFFFFGGDYTRTERLEYQDDEYYYYVKAVPKASVATSKRSIKKITGHPSKEEKVRHDPVVSYEAIPQSAQRPVRPAPAPAPAPVPAPPVNTAVSTDTVDYEKKLEESLKDL